MFGALKDAIPFVPCLAGLWLSIGRFKAGQPLAGLALAYGGVVLMAVAILLLHGRSRR